jgi:hypothetical protein
LTINNGQLVTIPKHSLESSIKNPKSNILATVHSPKQPLIHFWKRFTQQKTPFAKPAYVFTTEAAFQASLE